jgi:hypothetical protein
LEHPNPNSQILSPPNPSYYYSSILANPTHTLPTRPSLSGNRADNDRVPPPYPTLTREFGVALGSLR